MSDGSSPERSKSISRRDFFRKAGTEVGKAFLTGTVAGVVVNSLSQGHDTRPSTSPLFPTPTPDVTRQTIEAEPPKNPTETPKPVEPPKEVDKEAERRENAILSMKKLLAYFPGLLDNNPNLKTVVENKSNSLSNKQFRIRAIPEHDAKLYEFILDPNTPPDAEADIKFLKQTNRGEFEDMLSIEFNVDKSGKLIPQMKNPEKELTNDELKQVVSKMTQFAPDEWVDRTIFDDKQNKAVPHGVEGSNDLGQPRSYVQAQPNGHLIFILFTPPENPIHNPSTPSIIPSKGDVLIS